MVSQVKLQSRKGARKNALLLGAGYCARALIPALASRGYAITGTTRQTEKFSQLSELGITPCLFNGSSNSKLDQAIKDADIILSSIPPIEGRDPVISAYGQPLMTLAAKAEWVGYLSATSVYGDRQGQWVFEDEAPLPITRRGRNRANAELAWFETGLPVHVFRLAGIYGPPISGLERNAFERIKTGRARAIYKPGHVVNRIHVEDIARALICSIDNPNPVSIYNIADDEPAPPDEVLKFAADILGARRAQKLEFEKAQLTPLARSFYLETKRVNNEWAKRSLGWMPQYPNYRKGLLSTLKAKNGHTNEVYLAGYIDVPAKALDHVRRALPTHSRLSQAEKDCAVFRVRQDPEHPARFNVFEIFTNKAAYDRHQARMKNSEWAHVTRSAVRHYDVIGAE